MPTEYASPAPRYVTLRDYLRVLQRYWMLIALLALVGAIAGLANTLRQSPSYAATAQVSFQDPAQNLSIVGLAANPQQTPSELAAVNSDTATTPQVLSAALRRLHTSYTAHDLAAAISTQSDATSGLLMITATANGPASAAQLANAVAGAVVDHDNAQARAQFARLAKAVEGRITQLTRRGARAGAAAGGQIGFYSNELARVNTLAAVATTAQLANAAQPPTGTTGTSRTRSLGLGLLLGLLLGIAVAFIRDATDRRLRSLAEIKDSFSQPVLGHVHADSLGRVVPPAGSPGELEGFDRESFRILRRNLEFLDRNQIPRLILVTSGVPEEGKTTVAGSLAMAMAATGRRTLLVDCDLRRPALAKRLGTPPSPGLSEYLSGSAGWHEILTTVDVGTRSLASGNGRSSNGNALVASNGGTVSPSHGPADAASAGETIVAGDVGAIVEPRELVLVPAGSPSSRSAELLGSTRFRAFLDAVAHAYEVVVLDSTPLLPVSDTLEIVPHVDAMIICARASQTTREQASAVQAALSHFPERPTGLVVTGVKPGDSDYADYSYSYNYV
jgi:Mrp family chromosome partitioning ATPase/capsular polysaccharide biosynthesis protein